MTNMSLSVGVILSAAAQEVINVLEEVRRHPDTEKHLSEYQGVKWLNMCNIVNGHVEDVTEEYKALMGKLSDALHDHLIDGGQHSDVYYELKKEGYRLRTGERDSFGPLSAVVCCPNADWQVCYG